MPEGLVAPVQERGVYFKPEEYAGFFRRLFIDIIDIVTAILVWFCLASLAIVFTDERLAKAIVLLLFPTVWFSYFVLLKRSSIRTLGYKLGAARIVSLQGSHPGIPSLTLRFLFSVFGPLNFLFDLLWIPSDKHRQALRDKFAHTYVVRADAKPAGHGRIVYCSYHVLGASYLFQEVRPET